MRKMPNHQVSYDDANIVIILGISLKVGRSFTGRPSHYSTFIPIFSASSFTQFSNFRLKGTSSPAVNIRRYFILFAVAGVIRITTCAVKGASAPGAFLPAPFLAPPHPIFFVSSISVQCFDRFDIPVVKSLAEDDPPAD